jgi:hypothetical protein
VTVGERVVVGTAVLAGGMTEVEVLASAAALGGGLDRAREDPIAALTTIVSNAATDHAAIFSFDSAVWCCPNVPSTSGHHMGPDGPGTLTNAQATRQPRPGNRSTRFRLPSSMLSSRRQRRCGDQVDPADLTYAG